MDLGVIRNTKGDDSRVMGHVTASQIHRCTRQPGALKRLEIFKQLMGQQSDLKSL